MQVHLQQQVTQLVRQLLHIVLFQRLHHLVGLLDDIAGQRLVRLFAIPWTAIRLPPQTHSNVAQRLRQAQRRQLIDWRHIQRAEVIGKAGAAIKLVQWQRNHRLIIAYASSPHQLHRPLVGINLAQNQLDRARQSPVINLPHQQRQRRNDLPCYLVITESRQRRRVEQLRACLQRIQFQRRTNRLQERDPCHDTGAQAALSRQRKHPLHRSFPNQWMAGHSVNHRLRLPQGTTRQRTNLLRDLLVQRLPVLRFIIVMIKRLAAQLRNLRPQSLNSWMYQRAKVHRLPRSCRPRQYRVRLERQIMPFPRPQPYNSYRCCHIVFSPLKSHSAFT